MINDTYNNELFCNYYAQWIEVYKRGAIRDATMAKYLMTQKWVEKLVPELKVSQLTRTVYQQLLNDYAKEHERQTTLDFHHQLKGAILDAVDEGMIDRDPTRKAITPADFDFSRQTLSISKTWDYKGEGGFLPTKNKSSIRKIQIDWQIVVKFSELTKNLPENEPIFAGNKKIYNSTVNDILTRHCRRCGISEISIHGLRHPYVKPTTKKFITFFEAFRAAI